MKSSKYEYRVVTAPDGLYVPQQRLLDGGEWGYSHTQGQSIDECVKDIKRYISREDFIPQVVEIPDDQK